MPSHPLLSLSVLLSLNVYLIIDLARFPFNIIYYIRSMPLVLVRTKGGTQYIQKLHSNKMNVATKFSNDKSKLPLQYFLFIDRSLYLQQNWVPVKRHSSILAMAATWHNSASHFTSYQLGALSPIDRLLKRNPTLYTVLEHSCNFPLLLSSLNMPLVLLPYAHSKGPPRE